MNRYTYYDLIHHGIRSFVTDRLGAYSEPEFSMYLNLIIGKNSCSDMSDDELVNAVESLRQEGYLEEIKRLIPH